MLRGNEESSWILHLINNMSTGQWVNKLNCSDSEKLQKARKYVYFIYIVKEGFKSSSLVHKDRSNTSACKLYSPQFGFTPSLDLNTAQDTLRHLSFLIPVLSQISSYLYSKATQREQTVITLVYPYPYPHKSSMLRGKSSRIQIHVGNKSVGSCRLPSEQLFGAR